MNWDDHFYYNGYYKETASSANDVYQKIKYAMDSMSNVRFEGEPMHVRINVPDRSMVGISRFIGHDTISTTYQPIDINITFNDVVDIVEKCERTAHRLEQRDMEQSRIDRSRYNLKRKIADNPTLNSAWNKFLVAYKMTTGEDYPDDV